MAFDFNLDFLREAGDALKNFGKSTDEKIEEYKKVKEEYEKGLSDEDKILASREDSLITKPVDTEEEIKKQAKEDEDELDKRLKDISKVIDKFSGSDTGGTKKLGEGRLDLSSDQLNPKPIDFTNVIGKSYLSGVIEKPSSEKDRITLLYDQLRKFNLV
jgi:hypothetical protein